MTQITESLTSVMTVMLYKTMLKRNTEYYVGTLTLNKIKDIFKNKSETFKSCFWTALRCARIEYKEKNKIN